MSTALITGGSSGIGLELAKLFSNDGVDVILVAHNKEKLKKAASLISGNVQIISKDLSNPESCDEIYALINNKPIDYLINNAGFGDFGDFAETDIIKENKMLNVNIVALTRLTKLFLPKMIERGKGKILNLGSIASFIPGPYMAVYFATKAYVLRLTEAINSELNGTGVTVSCLCPPPIKSGFQASSGIEKSKLSKLNMPDSKWAAQIGYTGMMKNKTIIVPGIKTRISIFFVRFLPRSLVTFAVKNIQAKLRD